MRADLWCGICHQRLHVTHMPSGPIPNCLDHGVIDEELILTERPAG